MVSRNNKRTRNRNKKSRNKKSRNKRYTHKKSMNRYKRSCSLKKKRSKINYKKRTINKNKKLQIGGEILIGSLTPEGFRRNGNSNFESTFNEKNKQFYNAFLAAMDPESLKGCNPYLAEGMRVDGVNNPFLINLQRSGPNGGILGMSYNNQKAIKEKHEDTDNHVKFGLLRHSESSANWLLTKPMEMQNGYITAFLTPYGRVLAYSTGYYKYAEHIMESKETLKFYSSTLPRSMITAMLVLRGIIDRLESEDSKSEDSKEIAQIAQIYKQAEIQVCFGISEEPEASAPEKNTNVPLIHGSSDSYAQRIMDANMMEPMIDFINSTESDDYGIRLVLNKEKTPPRPFFWEEGDVTDAYRSSAETLDRFFNKLYDLDKENRHIFVVHGIIMEKYLSWVFFIKYFQDLISGGGIGRMGVRDPGAVWGEERRGEERMASFGQMLMEIRKHLNIDESETAEEIEKKWSKLLFLGGFKIETLRNMIESLNRLDGVLIEGEELLDNIQREYRDFFDILLKNIELEEESTGRDVAHGFEVGDVTDVSDLVGEDGAGAGAGATILQFNNLFEKINDPRFMDSQWFIEKYGRLDPLDQVTKFKESLNKPYSKTPNNCVGVFGTVVSKKIPFYDGREQMILVNDEERDDLRNIYLLHYMRDVRFMSPSLRFKYLPSHASLPRVYSPLLESIQKNTPSGTELTDAMIMQTFSKAVFERFKDDGSDILCEGKVSKQKPTVRTWEERYLVIRGNGIYFYNDKQDSMSNPKGARGSSCHDIRRGKLKIENERFIKGEMRGLRPNIIIEFPLVYTKKGNNVTKSEYIGTSYDEKDIQGRDKMEKFVSMKFSFHEDQLTEDEIGSQKIERQVSSEADDWANATTVLASINKIISGESDVSQLVLPDSDPDGS